LAAPEPGLPLVGPSARGLRPAPGGARRVAHRDPWRPVRWRGAVLRSPAARWRAAEEGLCRSNAVSTRSHPRVVRCAPRRP
jgi:hypothetical protein